MVVMQWWQWKSVIHVQICCFANLGPSSFFSSFSVVRPTQIFAIFKQKKSNNLVKPFFTWNNSFNLRNEHSNSIVRKTGTKPGSFLWYIVYFVTPNMWMLTFNVILPPGVPGLPIPRLLVLQVSSHVTILLMFDEDDDELYSCVDVFSWC